MPMYRPPVLGGNRGDSLPNSTDYGIQAHPVVSNVQTHAAPEVNPLSAQTLGRKNSMWAFRNPVQGQGTFINQNDKPPTEIPHSDPGSAFALDRD
jgi:hypothetical protein